MKIYITQGHEKGIGLEVLFKSLVLLSQDEISQLHFLGFMPAVEATLDSLGHPYKLQNDSIDLTGRTLKATWLKEIECSQSFTALKMGMRKAEKGGILYTLPTSKDQFPAHAGHTEYFREHYGKPDLGMFFSAPTLKVLLLSDHIALKKVADMDAGLIHQRLNSALKTFKRWHWPVHKVLVAGINPHAGEGGLIGKEDAQVSKAIKKLNYDFPIEGPIPGDTMLLQQSSANDLLVYVYHDQGLGVFKGLQGFVGSNITLGLPYPRFSPDHGTSFSLYRKNQADYRGCLYSLREALNLLKRL